MSVQTQFTLSFLLLLCACSQNNVKWEYNPLSESVIEVNFQNEPPSSYFINAEGRTILPRSWFRTDPIEVQNAGKYYINLTTDRPMKVSTNIAEENYQIFVFPNDTTRMNLEFMEEGYQLEFHGSSANINNYLAEKAISQKTLNIDNFTRRLSYTNVEYAEFARKTDSIAEREIEYLENNKRRCDLSNKFVEFEKAEIKFSALSAKLERGRRVGRYDRIGRFIPPGSGAEDFYMQYLKSPEIDNSMSIYSQSYMDYIHSFIMNQTDREVYYEMTNLEQFENDMKLVPKFLEDKTAEIYRLSRFSGVIRNRADKSRIDSLAEQYRIEDYQPFINLRRNKRQKRLSLLDTIPEFYFSDTQYNLYSLEYFRNTHLFVQFCDEQVDATDIGSLIFSKISENYADCDDLKFIKIYMNMDTDKWLSSYAESTEEPGDFIVEGSWNRHLKELFGMEKLPYYVLTGKHNVLLLKTPEISLLIQDEIDSLLNKDTKAL